MTNIYLELGGWKTEKGEGWKEYQQSSCRFPTKKKSNVCLKNLIKK